MLRFIKYSFLILLSNSAFSLFAFDENKSALINDDQLTTFAKQLEASIENRNTSFFNISFNADSLVNDIISHSNYKAGYDFNQGFTDGIKSSFDFGSVILKELGEDGSITFIHAISRNNESWLVFRLISDNGLNYHEYKTELIDGRYAITDAYFYLSGEKLSESVAQIYLKYLSLCIKPEEQDVERLKALEELDNVKLIYAQGKSAKAYKEINKISGDFKSSKIYQCAMINIAANLKQNTYQSAYNEFMLSYPDEPGKYLIPLDGLISHGLYEYSIQCLDSLDSDLLSDPLLDYFRANVYYKMNDLVKASDCLVKVIDAIPDFEMGYLSLLRIYLTKNQFREATVLLNAMITSFNTYKEDLYPFLAGYPEFLNSSYYQEWIKE
jgi:hypothetical protein